MSAVISLHIRVDIYVCYVTILSTYENSSCPYIWVIFKLRDNSGLVILPNKNVSNTYLFVICEVTGPL